MPAKGSCCCTTVFGPATMWKVNVFTGEVVEALEYVNVLGDPPAAGMCGIDDYDAVEFGDVLSTSGNTRLWDKSGGAIWGPLTARTVDEFRGWACLIADHILYGGASANLNASANSWMSTGGALRILARADGAQVTHSMLGKLIHAQDDYVDTFTQGTTGTIRRYEASDFSTVRASSTLAGMSVTLDTISAAFSQASYAMIGGTTLNVVNPSDLGTRFTATTPSIVSVAVDDEGGVYVYGGGGTDRILKYSTTSTPDWDVTDAAFVLPRVGTLGSIYGLNTITRIITKIDGADGSIPWACDFSALVASGGDIRETQIKGHSGMLFVPCGSNGLVAIDDHYGTVEWYSPNKSYGRPIPDGDDYVWLSGLYGT